MITNSRVCPVSWPRTHETHVSIKLWQTSKKGGPTVSGAVTQDLCLTESKLQSFGLCRRLLTVLHFSCKPAIHSLDLSRVGENNQEWSWDVSACFDTGGSSWDWTAGICDPCQWVSGSCHESVLIPTSAWTFSCFSRRRCFPRWIKNSEQCQFVIGIEVASDKSISKKSITRLQPLKNKGYTSLTQSSGFCMKWKEQPLGSVIGTSTPKKHVHIQLARFCTNGSSCHVAMVTIYVWAMMFFSDLSAPSSAESSRGDSRSLAHRGLENDLGDNHCFLNVVIQALWNLQSFRKLLLNAPWHQHDGEDQEIARSTCCYCALKSLFNDFASSEADTIPPDSLRQALSSVYDAKGRFKTGDMEDATETIEAILGILHACNVQPMQQVSTTCNCSSSNHLLGPSAEFVEEASNFGCHPVCLAHQVFGLEVVDVARCSFCGATGEPSVAASYVYSAYVTELETRPELPKAWPDLLRTPRRPFAETLRKLCQPDAWKKISIRESITSN